MLEVIDTDDVEWAVRSDFWRDTSAAAEPRRRKRERRNFPMILTGFGVSLKVENGALIVRNGYTHYPQQREDYRFFKGQLDVPERIIMLDGNGSLSFSVIDWLADQDVVLVRIGWDGKATIAVGGAGSPTDASKLRWQFELENNATKRIAFAAGLISQKLDASRETLLSNFSESEIREKAISKINDGIARLSGRAKSIDDVLAIEGGGARAYFDVWRGLEMKWTGRKPVPETWRAYDQRSSILTGKTPENYKAAHPINAMLNYAYAVLEADVRIKLVTEGYDPRIGILHVGRKRGKEDSFVFDMMEPLRPVVDAVVLSFVHGQSFSAADFIIRSDGACRLSPQLAKAIATCVQTQSRMAVTSDVDRSERKATLFRPLLV